MTIPTQAEDLVLREKIARAVIDGYSGGNEQWHEADETRRMFALMAADAVISAVPSIGGGEGDSSPSQTSPSCPQMGNETQSPFVFAALVKRPAGPCQETQGARGGIEWGASADEVTGRLMRQYQDDGWRVEILDVNPIPPACLRHLASFVPSTEAPPLILSGDEGPSCADSGGSQPQEAVKSDGATGLGGGET